MPQPSRDDADLWRRAMAGVAPLRRAEQAGRGHRHPPAPARKDDDRGNGEPAAAVTTVPAAIAPVPPALPDNFAGVDHRTADRLRRGRYPVEGSLDLHGMTQAEAHRALSGFLAGARAAGRRCVLVITGHGRLSGGVLKAAAPRWLAEPGLRVHVLTIAPARPQHGGAGALYVLLRRR